MDIWTTLGALGNMNSATNMDILDNTGYSKKSGHFLHREN
jgi:hypothetical protein